MNHVDLVIENAVATVTLNRPEVHNAFNESVIADLIDCFDKVDTDPEVRVMILQGKGKSFSAGADLNWMKKMASFTEAENQADAEQLALMLSKLYYLSKPTIAKVHGSVFGGAVGLVACCDIVIASRLSKFCLSEVKLGLIPATISPYVIGALGARNAKRLFMTAEVFSARKALELGLISETVSEEDLDYEVSKIADGLLKNGPVAVSLAKKLVDIVTNQNIDETLRTTTSKQIAQVRVSAEGQEGLTAFLEKRPANWIKNHD